jgi:hypothetical protein
VNFAKDKYCDTDVTKKRKFVSNVTTDVVAKKLYLEVNTHVLLAREPAGAFGQEQKPLVLWWNGRGWISFVFLGFSGLALT